MTSTIPELLRTKQAAIIDVRTPAEFMGGHVAGSINIPLNEIPKRMDEIRRMGKIVLCCASGMRSMNAASFLRQQGIDCYNGGPWTEVNYYVNNN